MKRIVCPALLALAVMAAPQLCAAQPQAPPTQQQIDSARQSYIEGLAKMSEGQYQEALALFRIADTIMGVPTTRLRVAEALTQTGQLVQGRDRALSVEQIPRAQTANEDFNEARELAAKLVKELDARVPTITFAITPTSTRTLFLDNQPAAVEPGRAMAINPGKHTIRAEADGFNPFEQTFDIKERTQRTIEITMVPAADPLMPERSGLVVGPVTWAGIGIAGAGLIVGVVAGGITLSRATQIEANCTAGDGNDCLPDRYDDRTNALTSAHVSTAGFVLAGVGATIGLIGLFAVDKAPDGQVAVRPLIGPGSVGLRGTF